MPPTRWRKIATCGEWGSKSTSEPDRDMQAEFSALLWRVLDAANSRV